MGEEERGQEEGGLVIPSRLGASVSESARGRLREALAEKRLGGREGRF